MSDFYRDFESDVDGVCDFSGGDFQAGPGFDPVCEFDVASLKNQDFSVAADREVPSHITRSSQATWPASAEASLRPLADKLPRPRAGLRHEFLSGLTAIERNREQIRRLPVLATCLLAVCAGYLRQTAQPDTVNSPVLTMQPVALPLTAGVSIAFPVRLIQVASQKNTGLYDDWNLVDVCHDRRTQQFLRLQRSLSWNRPHWNRPHWLPPH